MTVSLGHDTNGPSGQLTDHHVPGGYGAGRMPARRNPGPSTEDLLAAGEALAEAFRVAAERSVQIEERLAVLRTALEGGIGIGELTRSGERPILLHATNETLEALLTAGTRMRRLVAQAMYADGMTMDEIAAVLDVTRQRVSKLLSADPEPPGPLWRRHNQDMK